MSKTNMNKLSHATSFGALGLHMFPTCISNTHDWMQETGVRDTDLDDAMAAIQEAFGSKVTLMERKA